MTITEFKELSESIQALILSLGIIIGGIWAIFRFLKLQEIDKAKIELLQIQKQIEERGTIKLTCEVEQVKIDEFAIVTFNVTMANTGNRIETLNLQNCDVKVAKCNFNQNNEIVFEKAILTNLASIHEPIKFASISVDDEKSYPFVFKLPPGNYFFEFRVPGSPYETKRHRDSAENTGLLEEEDIVLWGLTKFVRVF